MAKLESVCRVLRDLGVFCLGVAAIMMAIDYLFIHPNPQCAMEKVMTQYYIDGLEKSLKHPDAK